VPAQLTTIGVNGNGAARDVAFTVRPLHDSYVMAGREETRDELATDESTASNDEHSPDGLLNHRACSPKWSVSVLMVPSHDETWPW
jgi:hypothetical protein